ncbi:hypothetical protein ILUMI_21903 [Ignelater luminosus]|uniref:Uncharacterized protein n=1 Tax=Ignelater luminosus TaxID=2038154 RepID=A0A8K0CFE9_IGNLU|nr:hypothetical protein ILUMI_21903 [Ignelater luminosus]
MINGYVWYSRTAVAKAVLSNNVCIGGNTYDFSGYSTRRDRKWTDGDLVEPIKKNTYFPKDCPSKYKNMTFVDIFKLFIDEEVVTVFVTETKKYVLCNMNVSSEKGKSTPVTNPGYDQVFGNATAPMISFLDELPDDKRVAHTT